MKVIPAIETALLIVGFKTVELLKTAVSPGRSGTFAGVFQFVALFQLLLILVVDMQRMSEFFYGRMQDGEKKQRIFLHSSDE